MAIPAIQPRENHAYAREIYEHVSTLCIRVVRVAVDCLKLFSLGFAVGAVFITPLTSVILFIAQRIQRVDYTEGIKQGNKVLKEMIQNHRNIVALFICVIAPFAEEMFFRGLIQGLILTRLPKYVIRKIFPGRETLLDTKVAKVVRIVLTAALFALAHTSNRRTLPEGYVKAQIVVCFFAGIGYGILKETRFGLLGSIGAHVANNVIATIGIYYSC